MDESSLPISCRFIPYDQWLVTHVCPKWKVRTVKHWILKKCGAPQEFDIPQPQRRPPSPIVFAQPSGKKRRESPIQFAPTKFKPSLAASEDDFALAGYEEDNEDTDVEWTAIVRPKTQHTTEPEPPKRKVKTKSKVVRPHKVSAYDPDRLVLLRYSTGQVLEEDYSLDWYEMDPFELIEVHRQGVFLRLPRSITSRYVQPYWEGWVQALRVVGTSGRKGSEPYIQKLEWRPRWVVVREGELSLCKDRLESPPSKSLTLCHLTDLRGAEHLEKSTSIVPEPHQRIICAKFKICLTGSYDTSDPTLSPSIAKKRALLPQIDTNHHRPISSNASPTAVRRRASTISHMPVHKSPNGNESDSTNPDGGDDSGESTLSSPVFAHDDGSDEGSAAHDALLGRNLKPARAPTPPSAIPATFPMSNVPSLEFGEWIVLDLPDDNGYTSLLRTLHRLFPHDVQNVSQASTFVGGLLPTFDTPPRSPSIRPYGYQSGACSLNQRRSSDYDPSRPCLPPLPRSNTLGAMPFPEWRTEVVRRARKAGLGNIGDAMGCVLWAVDVPIQSPEQYLSSRGNAETMVDVSSVLGDNESSLSEAGSDVLALVPSDSDSDASQVEWEGWMADLHRQARAVRSAPTMPAVIEDDFSSMSADLQRQHMEPTARVLATLSPEATLSSPSSNESLYRRSLRAAEQRRPSMPSIGLFRQEGSSMVVYGRQPSSLATRPSMPSLARTTSVGVLKKDKGKGKETDPTVLRKDAPDKVRKKKNRLSNPLPEAGANGSALGPSKKRSGLARGMEKIVRGLEPTLDFVDAR